MNDQLMIFESQSEEQTQCIGARLASILSAGAFVALYGDLAAGKTAFVRGFVGYWGNSDVSSPTFSIVHEYDTIVPIFHFDLYRISGIEDLESIGYYEYLSEDTIILMEWPQRINEQLPEDRIDIIIEKTGLTNRKITIKTKK